MPNEKCLMKNNLKLARYKGLYNLITKVTYVHCSNNTYCGPALYLYNVPFNDIARFNLINNQQT